MSEAMISEIVKKVELVIRIIDAPSDVKFYFTTSALNAKEEYLSHCRKYNKTPLFEPIVISVFEQVMQSNFRAYGKDIEYQIGNKEKKFVCFNRVPRLHRVMVVAGLLEKNLFDSGYCSLEGDEGLLDCIQTFLPESTSKHFNRFKNKMPLRLNITSDRQNPIDIVEQDIEYHKNSYFSIVNETTFYKNKILNFTNTNTLNSIFLTEKTYRPIVLKHPFLLVSRPYSLDYLRKLGYKTFHPFIDESYDRVANDALRLQKIIDEVERLCKFTDSQWIDWQRKVQPILEHNHRVIMEKQDLLITRDLLKLFQ